MRIGITGFANVLKLSRVVQPLPALCTQEADTVFKPVRLACGVVDRNKFLEGIVQERDNSDVEVAQQEGIKAFSRRQNNS
jgi:hypothetical protein